VADHPRSTTYRPSRAHWATTGAPQLIGNRPTAALRRGRRAAYRSAVPIDVAGDVQVATINGDSRSLAEWTTNFHLAMVVVDPFTYESSWILDTAVRILRVYAEADCRPCFVVTGTEAEAKQFMGKLAREFLIFVDPERTFVKAMDLETLPAFVHMNLAPAIETKAEGWEPAEWRAVAERLALVMSWRRPNIPVAQDPVPFVGTPALG